MIITNEEFDALDGMSAFDFKLYCLLRRHMDYETGIVGQRRRWSWQGLTEWMYVEPVPGRHRCDSGAPDRSRVRRAVERLERAGLLERVGPVVFRCILAYQDRSAQKSSDRGATGVGHTKDDSPKSWKTIEHSGGCETPEASGDRAATPRRPGRSDTPPLSGTKYSVAQHGSKPPRARVDPRLVAALAECGFSHAQVHTPRVMGMLRMWGGLGVTPDDVLELVAIIRERTAGSGKTFTPAYLERPMKDYMEKSRSNETGSTIPKPKPRSAAERAEAFWRITGEYAARSVGGGDFP